MCVSEDGQTKCKLSTAVTAVVSLIFHVFLTCLSITALLKIMDEKSHNLLQQYLNIYDINHSEKMDSHTFFVISSISLALSILGTLSSVLLIIGLKYNKPGYIVVYLCYSVQTSILLLIGGLLLCLKLYWNLAIVTFCLSVFTSAMSVSMNKAHEALLQDALLGDQNDITDITLLIEEGSDDLNSIPAE